VRVKAPFTVIAEPSSWSKKTWWTLLALRGSMKPEQVDVLGFVWTSTNSRHCGWPDAQAAIDRLRKGENI